MEYSFIEITLMSVGALVLLCFVFFLIFKFPIIKKLLIQNRKTKYPYNNINKKNKLNLVSKKFFSPSTFIGNILIVIIGVLIAIFLGSLYETAQVKKEVKKTLDLMLSEVDNNINALTDSHNRNIKLYKEIDSIRSDFNKLYESDANPKDYFDILHKTPNFVVPINYLSINSYDLILTSNKLSSIKDQELQFHIVNYKNQITAYESILNDIISEGVRYERYKYIGKDRYIITSENVYNYLMVLSDSSIIMKRTLRLISDLHEASKDLKNAIEKYLGENY